MTAATETNLEALALVEAANAGGWRDLHVMFHGSTDQAAVVAELALLTATMWATVLDGTSAAVAADLGDLRQAMILDSL